MASSRQVAGSILGTSLRDEPWQDLGYRARPKYSAFLLRLRAGWRVRLEDSIQQEIIIVLTAAHVRAGALARADLLFERGLMLVEAAHLLAVGSYLEVANDLPLVHEIEEGNWDFVLTVGGVFIAASSLTRNAKGETEGRVMELVGESFMQWNSRSIEAFKGCKVLYERTYQSLASSRSLTSGAEFITADSVGTWMCWNLLGHRPATEAERQLVRRTGVLVTHGFANWWGHLTD